MKKISKKKYTSQTTRLRIARLQAKLTYLNNNYFAEKLNLLKSTITSALSLKEFQTFFDWIEIRNLIESPQI